LIVKLYGGFIKKEASTFKTMKVKDLYSHRSVKKAGKVLVSLVALVCIVTITLPHLILPFFKKTFHE